MRATFDAFADDLAATLRAWRRVPWLPMISTVLGSFVLPLGDRAGLVATEADRTAPDQLALDAGSTLAAVTIVLVAALVDVGWSGTERAVYRRVWEGDAMPDRGLLRTTLAYLGRYVRLGLLVGAPLLLLTSAGVAVLGEESGASATVALLLYAALLVLLTFVTAELAFHTARASEALRRGVELLWRRRREVLAHATIPPLLLGTLASVSGQNELPEGLRVGAGVLGAFAASTFSGVLAHRWLVLRGMEPPARGGLTPGRTPSS